MVGFPPLRSFKDMSRGEFNGGSASSVPPGSLGLKKAHSLPDWKDAQGEG
jgi:hypothetical protein